MSGREIKFRGKRIDNGEWVYGDLCQDRDIEMVAILKKSDKPYALSDSKEADTYFYFKLIQVDPETVGQFTGIVDRDGKEICEDDCLIHHFGAEQEFSEVGEVYWSNDSCSYQFNGETMNKSLNELDECIVMGNIYDNPELLKQSTCS